MNVLKEESDQPELVQSEKLLETWRLSLGLKNEYTFHPSTQSLVLKLY